MAGGRAHSLYTVWGLKYLFMANPVVGPGGLSRTSVESYIWHPLSLQIRGEAIVPNDLELFNSVSSPDAARRAKALHESALDGIRPGHGVDYVVGKWAQNRGLRILAGAHSVVCPRSREVLWVNYLMESNTEVRSAIVSSWFTCRQENGGRDPCLKDSPSRAQCRQRKGPTYDCSGGRTFS